MKGNGKKILIVEDDRVAAEYLREIIEDEGYNVVAITPFAQEAIALVDDLKPDLIMMDIILRGKLTGCEAAVQIKQKHKNCKIIFLTAHTEKEMIDYATRSQADSYLIKPFRDEEILATITVILSQKRFKQDEVAENINLEQGFSFDLINRLLFRGDVQIPLNEQKIKLLELLVKNIDTTVSNKQISYYVWGEDKSDSTIRSLIYRTKESIGSDLIHNANGIGYAMRSA